MNKMLYIDKDGYICVDYDVCENIIKDGHIVGYGKTIGYQTVRYKVNDEGLFKEVTD